MSRSIDGHHRIIHSPLTPPKIHWTPFQSPSQLGSRRDLYHHNCNSTPPHHRPLQHVLSSRTPVRHPPFTSHKPRPLLHTSWLTSSAPPSPHSDYLRSETSPSVVEAAQTYFPSLDLGLLQQWWIYVDDGGSVNSGQSKGFHRVSLSANGPD